MNNLTRVLEKENAIAAFTGEAMDEMLNKIEKDVLSVAPDTSTAKGRKEIASLAHKVSKSKIALDDARKHLTAETDRLQAVEDARMHKRRQSKRLSIRPNVKLILLNKAG